MKLSMNWYLLGFFGFVLFIISQIGWTQGQQSQNYGVRGIEKDGDNIKLHFVFCNSDEPECRQTLTDDDGLASIIAVLSELKREYGCGEGITNVDDEVPNWDQILSFIEDRISRLQDSCHDAVCNANDPLSSLQLYGTNEPEIYLIDHCAQLIKKSEEYLQGFYSKDRVTYRDLEKLAGLLDKAPYNLYTVSGKSTAESAIASIHSGQSAIGQIARHHRTIQRDRVVSQDNQIQYFTEGRRKRSYNITLHVEELGQVVLLSSYQTAQDLLQMLAAVGTLKVVLDNSSILSEFDS